MQLRRGARFGYLSQGVKDRSKRRGCLLRYHPPFLAFGSKIRRAAAPATGLRCRGAVPRIARVARHTCASVSPTYSGRNSVHFGAAFCSCGGPLLAIPAFRLRLESEASREHDQQLTPFPPVASSPSKKRTRQEALQATISPRPLPGVPPFSGLWAGGALRRPACSHCYVRLCRSFRLSGLFDCADLY
jgi:hypothetical protein